MPIPRLPCDLPCALLRPFPPKISSSFKQCSGYPSVPRDVPMKAHCRGIDAALLEQIPFASGACDTFPVLGQENCGNLKAIPQLKQ